MGAEGRRRIDGVTQGHAFPARRRRHHHGLGQTGISAGCRAIAAAAAMRTPLADGRIELRNRFDGVADGVVFALHGDVAGMRAGSVRCVGVAMSDIGRVRTRVLVAAEERLGRSAPCIDKRFGR